MRVFPKSAPLVLSAIAVTASCGNVAAEPVPVSKNYDKPVLVHYMPWFNTPEFGGGWGFHWTINSINPEVIVDGERDIASNYYPLIGPYGSSDPAVIEYHLLLMKYAGADGVLVDWYGQQGTNPDVGSLLANSNALIDRTDDAGLDFAVILEDRFAASADQVGANVGYAAANYFDRPNYVRTGAGNEPLMGVFGPIRFESPDQWGRILGAAGEPVTFLTLPYESAEAGSAADGEYHWIWEDENQDDYYARLDNFYRERAPGLDTVMGVAYPGFDDFFPEGGIGGTGFKIPTNGTETFGQTLELARQYDDQVDILQLATWNDFEEGTQIEPTREQGFDMLVRLQEFLGVPYGQFELEQVLRLYNLRKQYSGDAAVQGTLDQAYEHFVALQVDEAVATLDSVSALDRVY